MTFLMLVYLLLPYVSSNACAVLGFEFALARFFYRIPHGGTFTATTRDYC